MKVATLTSTVAGLAAVIGGILYATGPGFRTSVNQHVHDWIGWTEAARQADPIGFTNHVEQCVQRDLETMHTTRGELQEQVTTLNREVRKHQALVEHADRLADDFRDAYRNAVANGGFPVTVREAAYTEPQVESQVSLLLAEADGYHASLERLEKVRQSAEQKLEALAVRINTTEAQLAMLPTQRELLRARVLSDEGEQLVAHVDQLLEGNNRVIQGNPVRSVAELMAAPTEEHQPSSRIRAAREFLTAKPKADQPSADGREEVKVAKAKRGTKGGKPAFEQN